MCAKTDQDLCVTRMRSPSIADCTLYNAKTVVSAVFSPLKCTASTLIFKHFPKKYNEPSYWRGYRAAPKLHPNPYSETCSFSYPVCLISQSIGGSVGDASHFLTRANRGWKQTTKSATPVLKVVSKRWKASVMSNRATGVTRRWLGWDIF